MGTKHREKGKSLFTVQEYPTIQGAIDANPVPPEVVVIEASTLTHAKRMYTEMFSFSDFQPVGRWHLIDKPGRANDKRHCRAYASPEESFVAVIV